MNTADMYLYQDIINVLEFGSRDENPRPKYEDGTPAHTLGVNHVIRKYNLKYNFPITQLRPIAWKSGIKEIFTIYQKPTNVISEIEEMGVGWWSPWDIGDGTIGERYGYVVKKYDLMNKLLDSLKNDPYSRRHIIDLYQYQELENTEGLHPCAFLTIWNVRRGDDNKEYLDMSLIQRSGDMLTASGAGGINECQYAALQLMVARHCGYEAGMFTHFINNEHVYDRHLKQANEMMNRYETILVQRDDYDIKPCLILNPEKTNFYDFTIDDFTMENYNPIKPQLPLPLGI